MQEHEPNQLGSESVMLQAAEVLMTSIREKVAQANRGEIAGSLLAAALARIENELAALGPQEE